MGGRGASSNINSRMSFKTKKSIKTREGNTIPKGTKISNIIEIAGGKRTRKIDDIGRLIKTYGGNEKDWTKRRGNVIINGERKEVHYYQNNKLGKFEFKIK